MKIKNNGFRCLIVAFITIGSVTGSAVTTTHNSYIPAPAIMKTLLTDNIQFQSNAIFMNGVGVLKQDSEKTKTYRQIRFISFREFGGFPLSRLAQYAIITKTVNDGYAGTIDF